MTDRSIWELECYRLAAEQRAEREADAVHFFYMGAACGAEPTEGASLTTSASIQMVTCSRCLTLTAAGA